MQTVKIGEAISIEGYFITINNVSIDKQTRKAFIEAQCLSYEEIVQQTLEQKIPLTKAADIHVGDALHIDGHRMVVMTINGSVSSERRVMVVQLMDPEAAQLEQATKIKHDQTTEQAMELIRKISNGELP